MPGILRLTQVSRSTEKLVKNRTMFKGRRQRP